MKTLIVPSLALLVLSTGTANALTISNTSDKEVAIGLDMGDKEAVHKIAGGKSVTFKNECDNACGVTGPWGFSKMAKTGETITTDGKSLVNVGTAGKDS
jgi:hypothetical protein